MKTMPKLNPRKQPNDTSQPVAGADFAPPDRAVVTGGTRAIRLKADHNPQQMPFNRGDQPLQEGDCDRAIGLVMRLDGGGLRRAIDPT